MRTHTFELETVVEAPLNDVFEFFSHPENLTKLTPASLWFKILSPMPIEVRSGALIEHELRLFGVPVRWLSEITEWDPQVRFVDVQRLGPYAHWEHEHRFKADGAGTRMSDRVVYAGPGGPFEPLIDRLVVRRRIEGVFSYRTAAIGELFAASKN